MSKATIALEFFKYNKETVHSDWERFKEYFDNYFMIAGNKLDKDEDKKVALATLLHAGGYKINDILRAQLNAKNIKYEAFL